MILSAKPLKDSERDLFKDNELKRLNSNEERKSEFVYSRKGSNTRTDKIFEGQSYKEQMKNNEDLQRISFTIKIKDQGDGISQEGIENLFLDFSRLEENQ